MLRILSLAVVAGLLTGPAWAGDQQTYKIKIKKAGAGTTQREEKTDDSTTKLTVTDLNGNVLQEKDEKKVRREVFIQTTLERKGTQRATRLKRKYEKATVTVDGETTALPYEGKTVLIEKKGDRYVFRIEGGEELTGKDAKELDKEFNRGGRISEEELEKALLPKKAVKVNEEWKIEPAVLVKMFKEDGELELDAEKTSGTGMLARAYKKDGRQFGVLVYRLKLGAKAVREDGKRMPVEPNSAMTIEIRGDVCIDGSTTSNSSSMDIGGRFELLVPSPDEPKARVRVDAKGKISSRTVEQ